MFTIGQIKEHLTGMGHSGTLNKVRNIEAMFERSAAKFLLKCHPLESMRVAPLLAVVHDDLNNYAPASDFGSLIDLIPEGDRQLWDKAFRDRAGRFDREKAVKNRTLSIEGSEGSKIMRINWKSRAAKVLNRAESLTGNGTWSASGGATGIATDTIVKYSGNGSIRFNLGASGGVVQNTSMAQVDMTAEDEIADVIFAVYLGSDYANLTSITPVWGNDVTTKYWTGTAQTAQADGTAFKFGWNIILAHWTGAVETGTVVPTQIDSFKATFVSTAAMSNVRLDNILFSIGRAFDHKYYSKYLFKRSDTGAWVSRPRSNNDDDYVVVDNDSLPLYLMECLKDMAHQMEGTNSAFDINFALQELRELFPAYKGVYPSQVKKARGRTGGLPARGRW